MTLLWGNRVLINFSNGVLKSFFEREINEWLRPTKTPVS